MAVGIHVGQCGSHVGAALWRLADAAAPPLDVVRAAETDRGRRLLFHARSGRARCVVVGPAPKTASSWTGSQPAHVLTEPRGRANNWAMGFFFAERGAAHLADRTLEALRKELETLDAHRATLVTLALGGGTGAGVGSRVLERLRDAYPRALIVTAAIAPSVSVGGSPLQNYNAMLTFQALQTHADAVIYRDNDEILRTTRYWRASDSARVALDDMNAVVAADLAGLILPTATSSSPRESWRPFDAGKFVHDLSPMPAARFVDLRSGILQWNAGDADRVVPHAMTAPTAADRRGDMSALEIAAKDTALAFPRASHLSIASLALVRGFTAAQGTSEVVTRWVDAALPRLTWPASPVDVRFSPPSPFLAPSRGSQRQTASVTMCGNNGHFIPTARVLLDRARRQFRARAYLHWYEQHGLALGGEHDTFRESFDACDALIGDYEALLADA